MASLGSTLNDQKEGDPNGEIKHHLLDQPITLNLRQLPHEHPELLHQGLKHQELLHQGLKHQEPEPSPEPPQGKPENFDPLAGGMSERKYQEMHACHAKIIGWTKAAMKRERRQLESERRRRLMVLGGAIFGAMGVVGYILRSIKIARVS